MFRNSISPSVALKNGENKKKLIKNEFCTTDVSKAAILHNNPQLQDKREREIDDGVGGIQKEPQVILTRSLRLFNAANVIIILRSGFDSVTCSSPFY
jgi:hypothetical protein